ncbi:MAG: LytR C-terminal domain-containing protein [Gemmatimonadota bacterium]|nr:LytR C-terminal domain-containing protein [Gemmatimonadota bacterium]
MSKRAALIVAGIVALVLVTIGVIGYRKSGGRAATGRDAPVADRPTPSPSTPLTDPKWATGARITVEVINATKVRGLARRAARALRDQGFDVVSTGTNKEQLDTTQVVVRTGHREWAERAAKAMGGGTVLVRPDSSRDVDLTVLIGATWRAPAQPFYP